MKVYFVCVYLLFNLAIVLTKNLSSHNNDKTRTSPTIIDVIFENIIRDKWRDGDMLCRNDILDTLSNAKNSTLWAAWDKPCLRPRHKISSNIDIIQTVQIKLLKGFENCYPILLDSLQLPVGVFYGSKYQLGNYDECFEAPWLKTQPELRFKYCLADIQLSHIDPKPAKEEPDPYGSTEAYINVLTKHSRKLNSITWGICVPSKCSPEAVAMFLKALLASSTLSSTAVDPNIVVDSCDMTAETSEGGLGVKIFTYLILCLVVIATTSTWYVSRKDFVDSQSLGSIVAKSFCMRTNAHSLVKPSRGDISVLHGMRAMSAISVCSMHQFFFVNSGAVGNGIDVDKILDKLSNVMHMDLLTDTFLLMSGLLLAKSLATNVKLENPLYVLWKRYMRLIGPMALMVFYMAAVSVHTGNGPIWSRLAGYEQNMCVKNWWLSLLMVNNYIHVGEMCYVTLWYIPVDYHLTILGVALIYLCRYHRRLGLVAVATVTILTLLLPAVATYCWRLPASIIFNIKTLINLREDVNFNSTYVKSHYRIGSYLVGLCVGTFMAVYKPSLHRNTISKKQSILTFAIGSIVAWIPMILGGVFYTRDYCPVEAAIYASTNRIVWAMALSSFVILCEYGNLPIVNGLLSWSAWVPLSRLSYSLYLIHPVIIQYNVFTDRNPLRQHIFTMLSDSFGPIVLGYVCSLLIWLLVEAPISNLTSYMHRKSAQEEPNKNYLTCNGFVANINGDKVKYT